MLIEGLDGLDGIDAPVVVVGSGPVGLALATDLARRGVDVVVLESGGRGSNETVQALAHADLIDPARHDDMSVAVARRLGGASNLWGGRCVPYDPVDFLDRPSVPARWPIGYDVIAPYIAPAVAATSSGAPVFAADTPLLPDADDAFSGDALERWVNVQAAQVVHADAIARDPRLRVHTNATVAAMTFADDGTVSAIEVAHSLSGERVRVPVRTLVLAAGGLETTRLLLAARRDAGERFGGVDGPLGRYYMGHVIGEIADIVFARPHHARAFDYQTDAHGSYIRRRIVPSLDTQIAHGLLNTAFWPIVPPIADPRHRSAVLSLIFLTLSFGPMSRLFVAEAIRRRHILTERARFGAHAANVLTGLPSAALFTGDFLRRRYTGKYRLPGVFVKNRANRYGLSYHAEHAPNPDSRVWLGDAADRLGVPTLRIDFRYSAVEAESLLRTHDLLQAWLERSGLGRIEHRFPEAERGAAILELARHGTHQVGLARMASHRRDGVVDSDLRCFDAPNLHLATCAVLPTSSQANPTLTAVALALRLSEHLAKGLQRPGKAA